MFTSIDINTEVPGALPARSFPVSMAYTSDRAELTYPDRQSALSALHTLFKLTCPDLETPSTLDDMKPPVTGERFRLENAGNA